MAAERPLTSPRTTSASSSSRSKSGLFGSPIENVLANQSGANSNRQDIPFIVEELITCLSQKKFMTTEGIFRVASDKLKVKQLKTEYEKSYKTNFQTKVDVEKYAMEDPHTVAALLKLYFYYFPVPLLLPNPNIVDSWNEAIKDKTGISVYSVIEKELSPPNKLVLDYLLDFLSNLAGMATSNKMSILTLSKVFGPILMPTKADKDPSQAKLAEVILKLLIEKKSGATSKRSTSKDPGNTKLSTSKPSLKKMAPNDGDSSETEGSDTERIKSKKNSSEPKTAPFAISLSVPSVVLMEGSPKSSKSLESEDKKTILSLQKQLQLANSKLLDKEKSVALLKQNSETGTKKQKDLEARINELEKSLRSSETNHTQLIETLRVRDKRIVELDRTLESSKESEKQKTIKLSLDNEKSNFANTQQLANLANETLILQNQLKEKHTQLEKMQKEMTSVQDNLNRLTEKYNQEQKQTIALQDSIDKMKEDNRGIIELRESMAKLEANYKEEQLLRKKFYNMYIQEKGNIRVYGRIRPMSVNGYGNAERDTVSITAQDEYTIRVAHGSSKDKTYDCDKVFGMETTQESVFEDVGDMIQSAVDGYNVCVFAYGQTGSGKTHTMMGSDGSVGIIPRSVQKLFECIEQSRETASFKVSCCMMELYNDELLDLFSEKNIKIQILNKMSDKLVITKDAKGIVVVQNINTREVKSASDLMNQIKKGSVNRHVETTNMNEHSSRSHLLISIYIETSPLHIREKEVTLGKLTLVDLAGSERVSKSGVTDLRLKEAQSINKSLSAIGHVISALSSKENFIPYRNNKLTMLLSDSIGGNAKTLMFVCVSPSSSNTDETISSLNYSERIRMVTNKATRNVEATNNTSSPDLSRVKKFQDPKSATSSLGKSIESALDYKHEKKTVLLNKSIDSITNTSITPRLPIRPAIQGRRAATKNALRNKSEIELKSAEAVAKNEAERANKFSSPDSSFRSGLEPAYAFPITRGVSTVNLPTKTGFAASEITNFQLRSSTTSLLERSESITGLATSEWMLDEKEKKLIRVQGRRGTRVEMVKFDASSVTDDCVFILDLFDNITVWNGKTSNRIEKAKAIDVATRMKHKERKSRASVVNIEGFDQAKDEENFWKTLGGRPSSIPLGSTKDEDDSKDILYKLEESNGIVRMEVLETNKLLRELIENNLCYILDTMNEVYIWQGRVATLKTKKDSVVQAQKILTGRPGRPKWTKVSKILEGNETILFKEKFSNWPDVLPIQMASVPKGNVAAIKKEEKPLDTLAMLKQTKPANKIVFDNDNGTGTKKIYLIKEFEKSEIQEDQFGILSSSESYIILYTYMVKWKECFIIYFWQGRDSSINEKGTSAYLTVNIGDQITNGTGVQQRVVQNQETSHFISIFKTRFIVMHTNSMISNTTHEWRLFHVGTRSSLNQYYPIQMGLVTPVALNTNDCFVLTNGKFSYAWRGSNASEEKAQAMKRTCDNLQISQPTEIQEGKEPSGFWDALGGKSKQAGKITHTYSRAIPMVEAKLFQCSNASGVFKADEIFEFCQDNLENGDVMLLDTGGNVLFVWMGTKANEEKKKKTLETAKSYQNVMETEGGRGKTEGFVVNSGKEPPAFTACFHGWDFKKTELPDDYLVTIDEMIAEYSRTYTIEELRTKPAKLDCSCLEKYLSPTDFKKFFSMTFEEFQGLLGWKQESLKRSLGLY